MMYSFAPEDMQELAACLQKMPPDGKLLAGGTDLSIALHKGQIKPGCLLYMGNVAECTQLHMQEGALWIGSAVTMARIAGEAGLPAGFEALREACGDVGSQQIRNRATIGGNVANASPAGDMLPVLCLLQARAQVLNGDGRVDTLDACDLVAGPGKSALEPGQAILRFIIPDPAMETHFTKLGFRKKVTIARLGLATGFVLDEAGRIEKGDIWVSAIAGRPVQFAQAAQAATGKTPHDPAVLECIARAIAAYIQKNTPAEFDRDYKVRAVRGIVADNLQKYCCGE